MPTDLSDHAEAIPTNVLDGAVEEYPREKLYVLDRPLPGRRHVASRS